MKILRNALLILLLVVLVSSNIVSVGAWAPVDRERMPRPTPTTVEGESTSPDKVETSSPEASSGAEVEPQWVPSSQDPGFYATRDNANLDPDDYNIVGGHQTFYWSRLEPFDDAYQWHLIDNWISEQVAAGKDSVGFGVFTMEGRVEFGGGHQSLWVPDFVFDNGAGKVICPDGMEYPRYWDNAYQTYYADFVEALAARYDDNPHIEFVQIGVGTYGEAQPCDDRDDAYVVAALEEDGWTSFTWPYIVNDIVDIYADAFDNTTLFLLNAARFKHECDRRTVSEHAISRGVGLYPAGLFADLEWVDLRTKPGWDGCGKYDLVLEQAETGGANGYTFPVGFETYGYMLAEPPQFANEFFWAITGAMSRRADYVLLERTALYAGEANDPNKVPHQRNIDFMGWAGQYLGKHVDETPSAWVLLRETGYKYSKYPQRGNYNWWLTQDDAISGGDTVPTTYRTRNELVRGYTPISDWLNTEVETIDDNPSLAWLKNEDPSDPLDGYPSYKGWICRRTDLGTGNPRMYFKIDDSYAYGGPVEATITVTYFDRGSDSWELLYDAAGNATKSAGTVTKTGTNRWKTRQFTVPDAMFANNQLGGADFHIDAGGSGDEYLHMVDVRVGEAAGETHDIDLITSNGGWNFVSTRLVPRSTNIEDVLSNIAGKYDLVQAYVDGAWRSYQPGVGGDLSSLDETMGFWIRVTQNCTLSVLGDAPASTTIHLSSAGDGWNMISWPSNDTRNVETALASIAGNYDRVYAYNALDSEDQWKVYDPVAPDYANDLAQLSPGHAYWVRVVTDCDLNVSY